MGKIVKEYMQAGSIVFVSIFAKRRRRKEDARNPRTAPTTARVRELNDRRAERNFAALLNHNFSDADYYITLTYQGEEPDERAAKKHRERFIERARYLYEKKGVPFRYIAVTEYKNKRLHHHLVLSGGGVEKAEIVALWRYGFARTEHLYTHGDYRGLAAYLIKETGKTFRNPAAAHKRRCSHSRNITMPETRVEMVKESELTDPKVPAGYAIEKASDYTYENPTTGELIRSYILVPISPAAKIKKLKRLRRRRRRSDGITAWLRKNGEYQLELTEPERSI